MKKGILLKLALILPLFSIAQHKITTFYDAEKKIVKENYYAIRVGDSIVKDGKYTIWHPNGKLWQDGMYNHNKLLIQFLSKNTIH